MARQQYPRCRQYRSGKHRFGNLSFKDAVFFRHERAAEEDICKCGFVRKYYPADAPAKNK